MTSTSFRVRPLPAEAAAALRRQGGPVSVADESPGYPCRQCLCDADIGEDLILVSYDPFPAGSTSPYRAASPIFLHREPCEPWMEPSVLPDQLTSRELSVRAFDAADMMVHGSVINGSDLVELIEDLLGDAQVDRLDVHNAGRGCFAARIDRGFDNTSTC